MGDQAVRWAFQQMQFDAVAQLILLRICKQVEDRDPVWIWKGTLVELQAACAVSDRTLQRHFTELESKARLFRGRRIGKSTEYIVLGPKKKATAAYIEAVYSVELDPRQIVGGPTPVKLSDGILTPPSNCRGSDPDPRQIVGGIKVLSSYSPSSSQDSYTEMQGDKSLLELWKKAKGTIQTRVDPQGCFFWFDPAHPVRFDKGVLTFVLPTTHHRDFLDTPKQRKLIIEAVQGLGLPVREITFVVRDKPGAVRARAAP